MAKWDWYSSTIQGVNDPQECGLIDFLLRLYPLSDWAPAKNHNGYLYGGQIVRGDHKLVHVLWGGNPGVNCFATSDDAPALVAALRAFGKPHKPTRMDACEDWHEDGLFESMSGGLIQFAMDNGLSIEQRGDWVRGTARTLYVGSRKSPAYLCLYEKGYEQGGDAPLNWVRLEARVSPAKPHREAASMWEPDHVFAAQWIPRALVALGWAKLESRTVGTVWRRSDDERARAAFIRQYGATISRWADELGSWEALGPAIQAGIADLGSIAKSSTTPLPEGSKTPAGRVAALLAD